MSPQLQQLVLEIVAAMVRFERVVSLNLDEVDEPTRELAEAIAQMRKDIHAKREQSHIASGFRSILRRM